MACRSGVVVSPGYLREQNIALTGPRVEPLQAQGKTVVFILVDGTLKGALALADIVRPEARQAIDVLKALDIRCMMLTGDNKATAKWVSDQVGLDEYFAEVLPTDKAAKVKEVQSRVRLGRVAHARGGRSVDVREHGDRGRQRATVETQAMSAPMKESRHMSTPTTNTNTVLIIVGTVIVVLLLVLVFGGGGMMTGGMMDWWR